jgi:predicted MFS family arabinose efflux permease
MTKETWKPLAVAKARVATSFIFLIAGLAFSSWAPMIPYIKDNLGLSEASLGVILLFCGFGGIASMPLTGWAINRFGSAKIVTLSTPFIIMLLPLLAISPSSQILALLLFAFGAAIGSLDVAMNSQSVAVEVHTGKPILSSFHCLFSLGGLFGAGIMSFLLKLGMTLLSSALCLSSIMSAILIWQGIKLLPSKADIRTENSNSNKFVLPNGQVLFYGALCFILFLAEGSMLDWGAVFLWSSHGYDVSLAGIGYAIFSIAMAIGRFMGDRLITRFGQVPMVRFGALLASTGVLLLVSCHTCYLELVGFFLIGLGAANIVPILFSVTGKLPNISTGVALTIVMTIGYTGMILGPAFIGFIAEFTTLSFALGCVAAMLLGVGLTASKIKA